ncbi:MAG: hypothetical protein WD557_10235, partial [Dehalococcoidia bacterium]
MPDAGVTDPAFAGADVIPPVLTAAVTPAPGGPPPPPRTGDDFSALQPPPPADLYPMRFDVAHPERLSRLSTLLRLPLLLPLWLLSYVLQYVLFPVWIGARVAVICK